MTHVAEFYDQRVERQLQVAFNERHLSLRRKLRSQGLGADAKVLEVGCGIGVMTALMAEVVRRGTIVAFDLSPGSIEVARAFNRGSAQVRFAVADARTVELDTSAAPFDFIVLLDILEHIPREAHPQVFARLRQLSDERTVVAINIPSPQYQRWQHEHDRSALQVIDQALDTDALLADLYAADFVLDRFETYDVWRRDEYQFLAARVRAPYRPGPPAPFRRSVRERLRGLARRYRLSRLLAELRAER